MVTLFGLFVKSKKTHSKRVCLFHLGETFFSFNATSLTEAHKYVFGFLKLFLKKWPAVKKWRIPYKGRHETNTRVSIPQPVMVINSALTKQVNSPANFHRDSYNKKCLSNTNRERFGDIWYTVYMVLNDRQIHVKRDSAGSLYIKRTCLLTRELPHLIF